MATQPLPTGSLTSSAVGQQTSTGTTGQGQQQQQSTTPSVQRTLTQMLSDDSAYMQQAEQAGKQQAASRGLLNTSMAGEAAQGAAIQAAAPIAQQDVAAQQQERMLGMSTAANLQGQYTQAYQSIMDNAAVSINEIETSQNIATKDKDKMIENTIARRDADLKFLNDFYNSMPVYQPNWTSLPSMPAAPGL